jgi:hypothetical protein
MKIAAHYALEKTPNAAALIDATFSYFTNGVLPSDIAMDDIAVLRPPNLIVSHTVAERTFGKRLS